MQFSIRTLLVLTLAVALVCCVFFALPDAVTIVAIYVLYSLLFPISIAGVVYGRCALRAFFIGCLVFTAPFALTWLREEISYAAVDSYIEFLVDESSPEEVARARLSVALQFAYTLLFGAVSAGVYWWLRPAARREPPKSPAQGAQAAAPPGPSPAQGSGVQESA